MEVTDTHPSQCFAWCSDGLESVLYSFIELFFSDWFPEPRIWFLLNNFTELFSIVRAWDGLCKFGRLSLFEIFTIETDNLKNFLIAKVLQFLENVSKAVECEVCQYFAIIVSVS